MAWVKFVREGIEIEVNAGMSVLEGGCGMQCQPPLVRGPCSDPGSFQ